MATQQFSNNEFVDSFYIGTLAHYSSSSFVIAGWSSHFQLLLMLFPYMYLVAILCPQMSLVSFAVYSAFVAEPVRN